MKRTIEIKNTELLKYGSELTDIVQLYLNTYASILNIGRLYSKRFVLSDRSQIFIHHTNKSVIIEK